MEFQQMALCCPNFQWSFWYCYWKTLEMEKSRWFFLCNVLYFILASFFQVLLISLSRLEGCWIIPGGKMEPKDQDPPEFSAMREASPSSSASRIALNSGRAWSLFFIFPPGIIQQPLCLDNETNSTWKKIHWTVFILQNLSVHCRQITSLSISQFFKI